MSIFEKRWIGSRSKLESNWKAVVSPGDSVVIPGDVSWAMKLEETVGDFAFAACIKLEEVEFGPNIKSIGMQAFRMCSALKRVVIHREGVEISEDAFDECAEDLAFEEPGT